jgi:ABC-2 type transport system ATP-binding protein
MEPVILAQNLHKSFAGVPAVKGVSLSIHPGEVYGLVGPDGAGKTTTMRLLVGALRPDSGQVAIGGHDLSTQAERAREQIGYMPQRFSLYGELTVGENLRFFAEVNGVPAGEWRPRTGEILEFVGLAEFADRRADRLSGGMRQKLGLATALVHQPRVLLLDEPTGGVDPVTRQDFWRLIFRLVGRDEVAVLVSTPYMDEAIRCNRVGFMSQGELIVEGSPQGITRRLQGRVLELVGRPRAAMRTTAAADADVEDVQVFGDRLHLRVRPGTAATVQERLPAVLEAAGGRGIELRPIAPTLEDAFIELIERQGA